MITVNYEKEGLSYEEKNDTIYLWNVSFKFVWLWKESGW